MTALIGAGARAARSSPARDSAGSTRCSRLTVAGRRAGSGDGNVIDGNGVIWAAGFIIAPPLYARRRCSDIAVPTVDSAVAHRCSRAGEQDVAVDAREGLRGILVEQRVAVAQRQMQPAIERQDAQ